MNIYTHRCISFGCKMALQKISFILSLSTIYCVDGNVLPLLILISSTHFFRFFFRLESLSTCRHAVNSGTLSLVKWYDILDVIRFRYAQHILDSEHSVLFSIRNAAVLPSFRYVIATRSKNHLLYYQAAQISLFFSRSLPKLNSIHSYRSFWDPLRPT